MKICVKSDLHHEFCKYVPFAESSETGDADVLVLAGDIDGGAAGVMWARDAVKIPVVYVAGNHEFYGHRRPQMLQRMREIGKRSANRIFTAGPEAANLMSIAATRGRIGFRSATVGAVLGAGGGVSGVGLEGHGMGGGQRG